MSWSDPCSKCGNHRADCDCPKENAPSTSSGVEMIRRERDSQLIKWSKDHDSEHKYGEIAMVAAVLCLDSTDAYVVDRSDFINENSEDPWGLVVKHKNDRLKQLQIAGALIAAEIDRILLSKT